MTRTSAVVVVVLALLVYSLGGALLIHRAGSEWAFLVVPAFFAWVVVGWWMGSKWNGWASNRSTFRNARGLR